MKAILISIKPKHTANILNLIKTKEVRKTMPKCDLPIDCYIYVSKDQEGLYWAGTWAVFDQKKLVPSIYNGKVVAKFTLNSVISTHLVQEDKFDDFFYEEYQLTHQELKDYVGDGTFYEWQIDNLEFFEQSKELSDFGLTKAPQSWCYVEVK